MNPLILDQMRADDSPAGKAALADYLMEHGVEERPDMARVQKNLVSLIRIASLLKSGEVRELPLGELKVRLSLLQSNSIRVAIYLGARRLYKLTVSSGDYDTRAKNSLRLLDDTGRRLLSRVLL